MEFNKDNSSTDLAGEVKTALVVSVKEGLEESKDVLIKQLEKKEFLNALVDTINKNVDIPMIGEKTEEKVFKSLIKCFINTLKNIEFSD